MLNEIKDIKAPIDLPTQLMWLWIILSVVLAVLLVWLVLFLLKRPQKVVEVSVTPTSTAWEKAYSRLENLRSKNFIERQDLKPFYSELSDIIRHYLEERFLIRAPEMTTEEFLGSLKFSALLDDAQKQTLKDFLLTCDMVKFAKHESSAFEAQKIFDLAKQLIDQTHGI